MLSIGSCYDKMHEAQTQFYSECVFSVFQELTKKITSTCEAIEEHIDPFDLNVCWPHAVKYLRQHTQQTQVGNGQTCLVLLEISERREAAVRCSSVCIVLEHRRVVW